MTTDGINLRHLAFEVLLAVEKEEEYSHIALSGVLGKHQYLAKSERAFLTRLCEGTLERQLELDEIIGRFSSVKINKLKPAIRCILRMGVYQIKYMDTVPDSAACNEAVKLAAKKGFGNLKGFVNGVLRSVCRNPDVLGRPGEDGDSLEAWAVRCSVPVWILRQWSADYGSQKAKSVAGAFLREARTAIRTNRMRASAGELKQELEQDGMTAEPVCLPEFPDFDYAMYLSGYDYLSAVPAFLEGKFTVQDVSSMLAAHIAAPKPGDYVIDVCAAPGSKSLHAAELMQGKGLVEARDLTGYKVRLIEENISRCGLDNVRAVQKDARIADGADAKKADVVFADLPCSGLGVLRKKPEIRYRMTPEKERALSLWQREILTAACLCVKPGGVLLYSTCTINRMENEENTKWFLQQNPSFQCVFERQFFPDEGDMDGFYIAKLIRT